MKLPLVNSGIIRHIWRTKVIFWLSLVVLVFGGFEAWFISRCSFAFSPVGNAVLIFGSGVQQIDVPIPTFFNWLAVWVIASSAFSYSYQSLSPLAPGVGFIVYGIIPLWCSQNIPLDCARNTHLVFGEVPVTYWKSISIRAFAFGTPLVLIGVEVGFLMTLAFLPDGFSRADIGQVISTWLMWVILGIASAFQGAAVRELNTRRLNLARVAIAVFPFIVFRFTLMFASELVIFQRIVFLEYTILTPVILLIIGHLARRDSDSPGASLAFTK